MISLYPSLIAADPLNLAKVIKDLEPYCPGFHIDIMDGHFVPNITFGLETCNAIAQLTDKQLWVHLMVENVELWIDRLKLQAGSLVTFHIEAPGKHRALAQHIRGKHWQAGIAVNPSTKIEDVFPFIHDIDHVLVMTVQPGFSGQPFLHDQLAKLEPLMGYRQTSKANFKIGIDGGVNGQVLKQLCQKNIDDAVVGNALFGHGNAIEAMKQLQTLCT